MSKLPLYDALKRYVDQKKVHFDVPGHKRNPKTNMLNEFMQKKLIDLDVSSAKDLDMLSTPTGVIKEASRLMAKAFSSDDAYLMVNGTTSAVQTMILAAIKPGEKILLPRNIHKSAMNALILSGAVPTYIEPVIDTTLGIAHGITVDALRQSIEQNKDARAILIINPTYYGAASDLRSIIKMAHDAGMLVLADEAHGAHFYFNENLPEGAMTLGADLSAVSLHKTGGSLTQSSVLLAHRKHLDTHLVERALKLTLTTSPSYLLLASLDVARAVLEEDGSSLLEEALELAEGARVRINQIPGYYALGSELIGTPGVYDLDLTKLSVQVSGTGLTGFEVYDILRDEYSIQVELGDVHTIIAIVSLGDSKRDLDHLVRALEDIRVKKGSGKTILTDFLSHRPVMVVTPREAYYASKKAVPLMESVGEIAGESVMAYPPGIPIVAPGEKITKDVMAHIEFLRGQDCVITGTDDPTLETILVLGS